MREMPQAWSTLVVQRAGSPCPAQTPVGPGVKRLRPEDTAWCLPPRLGRGSLVVQGGDVGARLGGRGVALRPLQTWNGDRASGEDMRQGPEGEPPSQALRGQCWALEAASHRLAREGIRQKVRQRCNERQNRWDAEVGSLPRS